MVRPVFFTTLLTIVMIGSASAAREDFSGRWALSIEPRGAGWLEVVRHDGWYDASILWIGGSVVPVSGVTVQDETLTLTRTREVARKDAAGNIVRRQQFTEVITGRIDPNGMLRLTSRKPRDNGTGFDVAEVTGKRIPALPPKPDLSKVTFGEPLRLFSGSDLGGWQPTSDKAVNAWRARGGVLDNAAKPHRQGEPRVQYANLRTEREFEDFNLKFEVQVPPNGNSGVYLRGIYEVQVADSFGKDLDSHNMGAIYSRITPTRSAEKKADEWQSLDITLVDRHVTVILNGKTIIDNQPLLGCTGGALWSDEFRPGPIYLQGDHGPVQYRNIILRPVVR